MTLLLGSPENDGVTLLLLGSPANDGVATSLLLLLPLLMGSPANGGVVTSLLLPPLLPLLLLLGVCTSSMDDGARLGSIKTVLSLCVSF